MGHKVLLCVAAVAIGATGAMANQDAGVSAEATRLVAEHPNWAKWLSDPELARSVLTGEQLPNSPWRVHDIRRPQPPRVDTGTGSCSGPVPSDAEVLFDGHDLAKWTGEHFGEWTLHGGVLTSGGRVYNFLRTNEAFGDVQLHVEWMTPQQPKPPIDPQHRGNSGVFLMGLYELQIVDSYGDETYPDGTAGAIFGTAPPLANPTRPPGVWNCYDIVFRSPRFVGGKLESPAWVTVLFNGVMVQAHTMLLGPTATEHGAVAHYVPHPPELPLALQDHGNVESRDSFRNIWVRRLKLDR
jgi:hypothetical protein